MKTRPLGQQCDKQYSSLDGAKDINICWLIRSQAGQNTLKLHDADLTICFADPQNVTFECRCENGSGMSIIWKQLFVVCCAWCMVRLFVSVIRFGACAVWCVMVVMMMCVIYMVHLLFSVVLWSDLIIWYGIQVGYDLAKCDLICYCTVWYELVWCGV
jgi:hypothetical protein